MYQAFNVVCRNHNRFADYLERGWAERDGQAGGERVTFREFLMPDGAIDAALLSAEWFPQGQYDVFLSHSHRDEHLALGVAGWLRDRFGISTFVDSAVWGLADDLLREIDEDFSQTAENLYSYELRNRSTAHVHLLLAAALATVIDRTELLFFLNTSASIPTLGSGLTESPWIYTELQTATMIRRWRRRAGVIEEAIRTDTHEKRASLKKALRMSFAVDLSAFATLRYRDLTDWAKHWKDLPLMHQTREQALNLLCDTHPSPT